MTEAAESKGSEMIRPESLSSENSRESATAETAFEGGEGQKFRGSAERKSTAKLPQTAGIASRSHEENVHLQKQHSSGLIEHEPTQAPDISKDAHHVVNRQAEDAKDSGAIDLSGENPAGVPEEQSAAKRVLPMLHSMMEAAERAQNDAEAAWTSVGITRELEEIGQLDARIRSFHDLAHIPQFEQLLALVKKGNGLLDAYKLAAFDELAEKREAATRQKALNAFRSKAHLETTKIYGTAPQAVPEEVAAQYRSLIPGITDRDIQAHYQTYAG